MVRIKNWAGPISIEDLELDGNLAGLIVGGQFGDTGWQIPATGIMLTNNQGSERLTRVHAHHHALDGLCIDGITGRETASVIESVLSEYNARQGCSIVGGRNYSFVNCRFNHTGKAHLVSAPGAGVDIEAEEKTIRNLHFSRCEFSNNTGPGMVADTGDSKNAQFERCLFIGTTSWAAWPRKPLFRFKSCQFVGSICNTFGDRDKSRAAQFHDCKFVDDPAVTPTASVYRDSWPIADLSSYENVLFNRCRFKLTNKLVLPWSISALYNDCIMSQVSTKQAFPRGTYTRTNLIHGNVDLYGSRILGNLTVNGRHIARTR